MAPDIDTLIQDVVHAAKLPPKARSTNIKPTVANLTTAAYDYGLLPDALSDLIDLVTSSNFLDQASLSAIVKNLYPATRVSRDLVVRVVACLGHGRLKASLNIQAALIRWLILVYHSLESPGVLSQAYPVLFSLLDTAATRLNLSRQTGNDPCLVGLLRVFKDYYPEIIVGEAVRGKASAFKHPDPAWRSRLDEIQDAYIQQTQDIVSRPRDGFRVNRPLNRSKRNKVTSVTLEEVENATSLAKSLEKLEPPNQLVAVLADPVLQKLLLLRPSDEAYRRIANWLYAVLHDVIDGSADEDTLWELLDVVGDFVVRTKVLPPVLLNFFARFFELWDGSGRAGVIFDILAYTPLQNFGELYQHLFQPFETAMSAYSTKFNRDFIILYTNLLHYWTGLLQAGETVPHDASSIVGALVRHVNNVALTLCQAHPSVESSSAVLAFYEQFVRLVTDERLMNFIRIELPPASLIYTLFFSNSLATVSRLCYVLARYKRGFEAAMATRAQSNKKPQIDTQTYDRVYVNLYNGFLMDICNCLWRSRAFSVAESNAHGCLIPRPTVDALTAYVTSVERTFALASLFGLSYSPVICHQSIKRVREAEDEALANRVSLRTRHAGPVTQASLTRLASSGGITLSWSDYRIGVLNGLSEEGLPGIAELLKCTMTVLKNTMEGRRGSSQVSQ
ncbi:centromere protein I [Geosmithia morbida]|uniref:Centromere protein I n=1 Tax=Geosmithia morbida TaxID=1094350 RepID=A0A9P4YPF8_9HYPO|nr:centromere protein I [Geosmithia morbida]KAF4119635.1 centromere protein I [Geosmithia morbida]